MPTILLLRTVNSRPITALTSDNESVTMDAAASCRSGRRFPKLIVFDLDYTLWPYWVDTHISFPVKKESNGKIVDRNGKKVTFYPEVPDILKRLVSEGYFLGIASRTEYPDGAKQLLKLFGWENYFQYTEIYPGRKTTHFKRFHEKTGIKYSDMLFFDDEHRNILDINALGVRCILVRDGVTNEVLDDALKEFSRRNQI